MNTIISNQADAIIENIYNDRKLFNLDSLDFKIKREVIRTICQSICTPKDKKQISALFQAKKKINPHNEENILNLFLKSCKDESERFELLCIVLETLQQRAISECLNKVNKVPFNKENIFEQYIKFAYESTNDESIFNRAVELILKTRHTKTLQVLFSRPKKESFINIYLNRLLDYQLNKHKERENNTEKNKMNESLDDAIGHILKSRSPKITQILIEPFLSKDDYQNYLDVFLSESEENQLNDKIEQILLSRSPCLVDWLYQQSFKKNNIEIDYLSFYCHHLLESENNQSKQIKKIISAMGDKTRSTMSELIVNDYPELFNMAFSYNDTESLYTTLEMILNKRWMVGQHALITIIKFITKNESISIKELEKINQRLKGYPEEIKQSSVKITKSSARKAKLLIKQAELINKVYHILKTYCETDFTNTQNLKKFIQSVNADNAIILCLNAHNQITMQGISIINYCLNQLEDESQEKFIKEMFALNLHYIDKALFKIINNKSEPARKITSFIVENHHILIKQWLERSINNGSSFELLDCLKSLKQVINETQKEKMTVVSILSNQIKQKNIYPNLLIKSILGGNIIMSCLNNYINENDLKREIKIQEILKLCKTNDYTEAVKKQKAIIHNSIKENYSSSEKNESISPSKKDNQLNNTKYTKKNKEKNDKHGTAIFHNENILLIFIIHYMFKNKLDENDTLNSKINIKLKEIYEAIPIEIKNQNIKDHRLCFYFYKKKYSNLFKSEKKSSQQKMNRKEVFGRKEEVVYFENEIINDFEKNTAITFEDFLETIIQKNLPDKHVNLKTVYIALLALKDSNNDECPFKHLIEGDVLNNLKVEVGKKRKFELTTAELKLQPKLKKAKVNDEKPTVQPTKKSPKPSNKKKRKYQPTENEIPAVKKVKKMDGSSLHASIKNQSAIKIIDQFNQLLKKQLTEKQANLFFDNNMEMLNSIYSRSIGYETINHYPIIAKATLEKDWSSLFSTSVNSNGSLFKNLMDKIFVSDNAPNGNIFLPLYNGETQEWSLWEFLIYFYNNTVHITIYRYKNKVREKNDFSINESSAITKTIDTYKEQFNDYYYKINIPKNRTKHEIDQYRVDSIINYILSHLKTLKLIANEATKNDNPINDINSFSKNDNNLVPPSPKSTSIEIQNLENNETHIEVREKITPNEIKDEGNNIPLDLTELIVLEKSQDNYLNINSKQLASFKTLNEIIQFSFKEKLVTIDKVPGNGHCLHNALSHSLQNLNQNNKLSYNKLRKIELLYVIYNSNFFSTQAQNTFAPLEIGIEKLFTNVFSYKDCYEFLNDNKYILKQLIEALQKIEINAEFTFNDHIKKIAPEINDYIKKLINAILNSKQDLPFEGWLGATSNYLLNNILKQTILQINTNGDNISVQCFGQNYINENPPLMITYTGNHYDAIKYPSASIQALLNQALINLVHQKKLDDNKVIVIDKEQVDENSSMFQGYSLFTNKELMNDISYTLALIEGNAAKIAEQLTLIKNIFKTVTNDIQLNFQALNSIQLLLTESNVVNMDSSQLSEWKQKAQSFQEKITINNNELKALEILLPDSNNQIYFDHLQFNALNDLLNNIKQKAQKISQNLILLHMNILDAAEPKKTVTPKDLHPATIKSDIRYNKKECSAAFNLFKLNQTLSRKQENQAIELATMNLTKLADFATDSDLTNQQKNIKVIAIDTVADGNCAFHAIFGKWEGRRKKFFNHEYSKNRNALAQKIRKLYTNNEIINKKIIKKLIKVAIREIIFSQENKSKYPNINILRNSHKQQQLFNDNELIKNWEKLVKLIERDINLLQYINEHTSEDKYKNKSMKDKFQSLMYSDDTSIQEKLKTLINANEKLTGILNTIKDINEVQFEFKLTSKLLKDYANFIEQDKQHLLPCEIQLIAYLFDYRIEYYQNTEKKPDIYNPECDSDKTVAIIFKAPNHFERVLPAIEANKYTQKFTKTNKSQYTISHNEHTLFSTGTKQRKQATFDAENFKLKLFYP